MRTPPPTTDSCILTREIEEAQARLTLTLTAIAHFTIDPRFSEPQEEEWTALLVWNVSPRGPLLVPFVPRAHGEVPS